MDQMRRRSAVTMLLCLLAISQGPFTESNQHDAQDTVVHGAADKARTAGVVAGIRYPRVTDKTVIDPPTLSAGGTAHVSVDILGGSRVQSVAVPASIVIAADRSGSMFHQSDMVKGTSDLRTRYNDLEDAVAILLDKLDPALDKAAIIKFGSVASGKDHATPLTNDFPHLRNFIDVNQGADHTRIDLALEEMARLLKSANSPISFGILMSDGEPTGGNIVGGEVSAAEVQRARILTTLDDLNAHHVTIHTIGLGANGNSRHDVEGLLELIARRTGGKYLPTAKSHILKDSFEEIYKSNYRRLTTKDVAVREELSEFVAAVDGSLLPTNIPTTNDEDAFTSAVEQLEVGFYKDGKIEFPHLFELHRLKFNYSFEIRARKCDPVKDTTVPLRAKTAVVTYLNGEPTRREWRLRQSFTMRRCGVHIEKEKYLDPVEAGEPKRLKITVRNSHDRPIRDLILQDMVHWSYFQLSPNRSDHQPVPVQLEVTGGFVEWQLDRVNPQDKAEFLMVVSDKPGPHSGAYDIQTNDHHTFWHFEELLLRVLPGDIKYPLLEGDLAAGSISTKIAELFETKLSLNAAPVGGTVSQPPLALREYGFDYQIKFSSPLALPSKKSDDRFMTELFFVRKVDGVYEVFQEFRYRDKVPVLQTDIDYVPTP